MATKRKKKVSKKKKQKNNGQRKVAERNIHKRLEKAYYNPADPNSYAGARKLLKAYGKGPLKNKVLNWLRAQNTYTLHTFRKLHFPRQHYRVRAMDDLWEADLVDLKSIQTYNDDYTFILVVIDALSKVVWCEPMLNKTNKEFIRAFDAILERSNGRKPLVLQTDKGKEFVGKVSVKHLKSLGIQHQVTRSPDVKCSLVERANKSIKERMWRYFTHRNTRRYIDILQSLVEGYNKSYHTTIKMAPASVSIDNMRLGKKI